MRCPASASCEATATARHFRVAGDLDPVIKAIARHPVVDLELAHPTLEEIFLTYYEEGRRVSAQSAL